MDYGGVVRIDRSRPFDKRQRGQRYVIGRVLIQTHFIDIVGAGAHGEFLQGWFNRYGFVDEKSGKTGSAKSVLTMS
jgi:hypothetical protein